MEFVDIGSFIERNDCDETMTLFTGEIIVNQ